MKNHIWKVFIPTYHCVRLFDVPAAFFADHGYKVLCIDLDNTLASFRSKTPSDEVKDWIRRLQKAQLKIIIVSNNKAPRVKQYLTSFDIPYLAQAGKPSPSKLKRFLNQHNIPLNSVIMIGDQLLTDCWMANQLGIDSLLTEKLVREDHWPTWINRILEAPVKQWLKRHHLLKNWRDET